MESFVQIEVWNVEGVWYSLVKVRNADGSNSYLADFEADTEAEVVKLAREVMDTALEGWEDDGGQ